jgi:hypothetical protein
MIAKGSGDIGNLYIATKEQAGALWLNRKVRIEPRFEAKLFFTISADGCGDHQSYSIDGIATILSKSNEYVQGKAGSMGYDNIFDALVTEIDLNYDKKFGDYSENSLSFHRCFRQNCHALEDANTVQGKLPYVNLN